MPGHKKLYLIGIDSVPLSLLKQLSNENGMEVFAKLIKRNQIADMESTLPPMTGPAWSSIYTGLNPGEHGVPDFFTLKKDYVKDLVFYDSYKTEPFWYKLARTGHKCLLITPAADIKLPKIGNIDMITGFPLPAKTNSRKLESLMKKYRFWGELDIEKDIESGKITDEEAVKLYEKCVKARANIAKEMIETNDYDFVYVCFTETDRLVHYVTNKQNSKDYFLPVCIRISKFVDYVMKRVEREGSAIVVLSDHGGQAIHNKFLINTWLVHNGYAKLKESVLESMKENKGIATLAYRTRESLMKYKGHLRKIYDRMPYLIKRLAYSVLGNFFSSAGSGKYVRLHMFDFDMAQTKAFAEVSNIDVATIWINDKRFDRGIVSNQEKKKVKAGLIRDLKSIKSAEGDRLLANVIDAATYYKNTNKFIAPDIFADAKPGYSIDLFNFSLDTIFMKPQHTKNGDHTRYGFFGFYSNNAGVNLKELSVLNVAPTVLDYFGVGSKGSKNSKFIK